MVMEDNMQNGIKYYQFGNPFKIKFRKHICFTCKNSLVIRKHSKVVNSKSPEAKYYDFTIGEGNIIGNCKFIHKVFYCPKCDKEIEPVTQLSYEDNEKWVSIAYSKLLEHYKSEQIRKVWIDTDGNTQNTMPDIEKLQCIAFVIKTVDDEYLISCSIVGRKKSWERPFYLAKDKTFNKKLKKLANKK